MNIGGKKRENTENSDYSKRVGLFESKIITINPTAEQYKNLCLFKNKKIKRKASKPTCLLAFLGINYIISKYNMEL